MVLSLIHWRSQLTFNFFRSFLFFCFFFLYILYTFIFIGIFYWKKTPIVLKIIYLGWAYNKWFFTTYSIELIYLLISKTVSLFSKYSFFNIKKNKFTCKCNVILYYGQTLDKCFILKSYTMFVARILLQKTKQNLVFHASIMFTKTNKFL